MWSLIKQSPCILCTLQPSPFNFFLFFFRSACSTSHRRWPRRDGFFGKAYVNLKDLLLSIKGKEAWFDLQSHKKCPTGGQVQMKLHIDIKLVSRCQFVLIFVFPCTNIIILGAFLVEGSWPQCSCGALREVVWGPLHFWVKTDRIHCWSCLFGSTGDLCLLQALLVGLDASCI